MVHVRTYVLYCLRLQHTCKKNPWRSSLFARIIIGASLVGSGDYFVHQKLGPQNYPLPSRFDLPEVWDSRAVIANAPSLITSQYRVDDKQGERGCKRCCYACRNTK